MLQDNSLELSKFLLSMLGTQVHTYYQNRVPRDGAVLVVSNHRSFMDAPVLISAIHRPIRFACHHYMGQVPVLRELVTQLGCFPLGAPQERNQSFFQKAVQLLRADEVVGVFPEGAEPMVKETHPEKMGEFQRGFAHLALRAPLKELAIVPIAIAANREHLNRGIPLPLLRLFDPSEPLFAQTGWHPMVVYQRVNVMIGQPYWIRSSHRKDYQGKQARSRVAEITANCHAQIQHLLTQGCY